MPNGATAESTVADTLRLLASRHEQEVGALRDEVARLRSFLDAERKSRAPPGGCATLGHDISQLSTGTETWNEHVGGMVDWVGAITSTLSNALTLQRSGAPATSAATVDGAEQWDCDESAAELGYRHPSTKSSSALHKSDELASGTFSFSIPSQESEGGFKSRGSRSVRASRALVQCEAQTKERPVAVLEAEEISKKLPDVTRLATTVPHESVMVQDRYKVSRYLALTAERMDENGEFWRAQCFRLITAQKFDTLFGMIIIANSLLIGLELSIVPNDERDGTFSKPTAQTLPFAITENIFLLIYIGEFALRWFASRWDCLRSGWVRFDLLLVTMGILGTWIIPLVTYILETGGGDFASVPMVLRVFRLARLARALRLFVQFRTLWMLVHGLLSSASTIMNVVVVLTLTLYVFSCIGIELITNNPLADCDGEFADLAERYWSTIPLSMLTLLQFVSFDSIGQIYAPMIRADPKLLIFFLPFLLIVSIVLMNLVTAIVVEAFLEHAKQDQELRKRYNEQRIQGMLPQLKRMFEELDVDGSGRVTVEELEQAPDELKEDLGRCLNAESLVELWEILDTDGSGEVSIQEFVDGISKLTIAAQPLEFTRIMKQVAFLREDLELLVYKLVNQAPEMSARQRRLTTRLDAIPVGPQAADARPWSAGSSSLEAGELAEPLPPCSPLRGPVSHRTVASAARARGDESRSLGSRSSSIRNSAHKILGVSSSSARGGWSRSRLSA